MENGILKSSLLSLEKIDLDDLSKTKFRMIRIYKHYLLCFKSDSDELHDCLVIDTQKKTAVDTTTGLKFGARRQYSLCYWKDGIFVLTGGTISYKQGPLMSATERDVQLLYVHEEDSKISFSVKACDAKERGWDSNSSHTTQIYKDNLYILGGYRKQDYSKHDITEPHDIDVWKFDLNAKSWGKCEITGEPPKSRYGLVSVLFNHKIYVFGGYLQHTQDLYGGTLLANDLFVLDLENMIWEKTHEDNFLAVTPSESLEAELVNQKIYLRQSNYQEFYIFDPLCNTLKCSVGVSPARGFFIASNQDQSVIYRFDPSVSRSFIEFQDLSVQQLENQTKNTLSPKDHMNFLWKDKLFADITFIVQGEEIPAHRVILVKCKYFLNLFNSGMIEANSSKINVPDISPTNFKVILEYIYLGKIALTEALAFEFIILADMYLLTGLKADCEAYLCSILTKANLLEIIKVTRMIDSQKLEDKIASFLANMMEKPKQEIDLDQIPQDLFLKATNIVEARKEDKLFKAIMKPKKEEPKQTKSLFLY